MLKVLNKYLISIVVFCAIFYWSTTTSTTMIRMPRFYGADKVAHILMYVCLAFALAMENSIVKFSYRFSLVFIMPIIYGGLIEILQEYCFPPRTGDWFDWIADILGVALGCLLATKLCSIRVIRMIFRR